jgi:hypothetical protein
MSTLTHDDHASDHDTSTTIPVPIAPFGERCQRHWQPAAGAAVAIIMYMYGLRSTTACGSVARVRVIFKLSLNFAAV